MYGLTVVGGEEGVRQALRSLCREVVPNMHLADLRTIDEVSKVKEWWLGGRVPCTMRFEMWNLDFSSKDT